MLPRLQAEERLRSIADGAASAGNLERRTHRELVTKLEDAAGVERARPAKANSAALSSMGIGVRMADHG